MRAFSIYDRATGLFTGETRSCSDDRWAGPPVEAHLALMVGIHDHRSKKVDLASGLVIEHQPAPPSAEHLWDEEQKRWKLPKEAVERLDRHRAARELIARLEKASLRCLREIALGRTGGALVRLGEIDAQIANLRKELT